MFLILFAPHILLLHKFIGNIHKILQGLFRSALRGLLHEGVRQVLPIAIAVEWLIVSADPNKPPAPDYYIPKRARRACVLTGRSWGTQWTPMRKATYVALGHTRETFKQTAWARGIDRAWKKFWKTAPRGPRTKNKGRHRHYTPMLTRRHRYSKNYARATNAGQFPNRFGRSATKKVGTTETRQCRIRESTGMTCLASTTRARGRNTKSDPGYDSDSFLIAIDNACSYCITNDKTHFIGNPEAVRIRVKKVGGEVMATLKGTVSWSFTNDQGEGAPRKDSQYTLRCKRAILLVLTTACRPGQK